MLNCREITERASDYVDGRLPWPARMQVRMHLFMCRFCSEYLRQLALVIRTLPRLPRRPPETRLQQSTMAMFRAERS
jgi:anti-sigma factor RsiW